MSQSELRYQVSQERRWEAIREFYGPRRAPRSVPANTDLYDVAAAEIGADAQIVYLEFGVASGNSLRAMASRFRNPASRFIAFDSFLGLPERWLMHDRGAFSTGGAPPLFGDDRVEFVSGWFQNTVPDRLKLLGQPACPVLIHYDADLYTSTSFLLSTVWHHFPDYYFIMDDFIQEDAVALYDFSRAYPVSVEFFAQNTGGGDNPDRVVGRLRNIRFELTAT